MTQAQFCLCVTGLFFSGRFLRIIKRGRAVLVNSSEPERDVKSTSLYRLRLQLCPPHTLLKCQNILRRNSLGGRS